MVTLKSKREIEKMRAAGRIVAEVLRMMQEWVRPGVTTADLDRKAESLIRQRGAEPAFKGYRGFTGTICASVNEEVVHGIPGPKVLKEGDLFTADVGARWQGYYADAASTFAVGAISSEARDLLETTRKSLDRALKEVRPGGKLSAIARAIQETAEAKGYSVVRQFVGHGIGLALHEEPPVPNYVSADLLRNDLVLEEGLVLAIEPMVNAGSHKVRTLPDEWTVVTADGRLSAHFEHTVAVVRGGADVLTAL